MSSEGVNATRRNLLIGTSVLGAVGVAGLAAPFLKMWAPSERAKALGAPVEILIDKLESGQMAKAEWRGKVVWVIRRSKAMLDALPTLDGQLADPASQVDQQPDYAQNEYRSIKPEYLVLVGICTHLGCSPTFVPELEPQPFDAQWKGGFYCPCHKSRFDMAGRVYKGVPAPTNLVVPPYSFVESNRVLIGVNPEGNA